MIGKADLKNQSKWVLSGAVALWEPAPTLDYSLVVFLYLPPEIRIKRVRQREAQLYGPRIQVGGDMEKTHADFILWTSGYDSGQCEGTNTLGHHQSFLRSLKCPVIRLWMRAQMGDWESPFFHLTIQYDTFFPGHPFKFPQWAWAYFQNVD